jgi:putative membrane protein
VIWAVARITQPHVTAGPAAGPPRPSAEDVLADRLARGEISTDEYRERLAALQDR